MRLDYPTAARLREMGLSAANARNILNFRKLLGETDFTSVMTERCAIPQKQVQLSPKIIEYACNF